MCIYVFVHDTLVSSFHVHFKQNLPFQCKLEHSRIYGILSVNVDHSRFKGICSQCTSQSLAYTPVNYKSSYRTEQNVSITFCFLGSSDGRDAKPGMLNTGSLP